MRTIVVGTPSFSQQLKADSPAGCLEAEFQRRVP